VDSKEAASAGLIDRFNFSTAVSSTSIEMKLVFREDMLHRRREGLLAVEHRAGRKQQSRPHSSMMKVVELVDLVTNIMSELILG